MKTVALIPIKLNNERVPGKNVKPFFDGTPLMHFIQRACLKTKEIDEVYVFCSDEKVQEYLLDGVKFLQRPAYLDEKEYGNNHILKEFLARVDADVYVQAHATAPFTSSETLAACAQKVASGKYDSAFSGEKMQRFLWQNGKPINFDPSNFPRTQDLPLIYQEACAVYAFAKDTFLTLGRRVGNNPYIHEIDGIEAIDIDYPEDFEIANIIYKEIILK